VKGEKSSYLEKGTVTFMSQQNLSDQVSASLRKVLNSHGHGFHYAVVEKGAQLSSEGRSKWIFEGSEFPVSVHGQTTHVDFILTTRSGRTLIVAECKRADPALGVWCFARNPYTWRDPSEREVVFERVMRGPDSSNAVRKSITVYNSDKRVYHLGFQLKTNQKGDGNGQRHSAINEAVTQVLRSTSGIMNYLASDPDLLKESGGMATPIPAIFTTAHLWTTDVDLGKADLQSGNLDLDAVQAQKVDWIWFTHNRSPDLSPEPRILTPDTSGLMRNVNRFSDALRHEFARSVAIISPTGLESFLCWDIEEWLR
jgi:hypothetical protein